MGDGLLKPATNKDAWHKKIISKRKLEELWPIFLENIPLFMNEETKEFEFIALTQVTGGFVHPETDIEDDSLGIQPKTIVKYLEENSLEDLSKKLFFINMLIMNDNNLKNQYLDEGFVNWNKVFKRNNLSDSLSPEEFDFFNEHIWLYFHYSNMKDAEKALNKSVGSWRARRGRRVPQSEILQFIDPERFDIESMKVINSLYGESNLTKLSLSDHYSAVSLINVFGTNLKHVPIKFLSRYKYFRKIGQKLEISETEFKNTISIIEKMGLELNVYTLIDNVNSISRMSPKTLEKLVNMKKIHNLNTVISLSMREDLSDDFKDFALSIPLRWYTYVEADCEGGRSLDIHLINRMYELWNRRSKKQVIIPQEGKIGNYTYKVLDKTKDKDGLVLGYATDCCQLFGMQGEVCMIDGIINESSTFVAVYKKNKIYAQSWLWSGKDNYGRDFACFDSIELLGRDLEANKDVIECYKKISESLIKNDGFDFVVLGKDGNRPLEGIEKHVLGHKYADNEEGIRYKGNVSYTDTEKEGIYLLKGDWS